MEIKGLVDFVRDAWHAAVCECSDSEFSSFEYVQKAAGPYMDIYFLYAESAPGISHIQHFLHLHSDSVILVAHPGKTAIDIYAQSIFDASPIVANDVAWEHNDELAELGELQSYLEFEFELDRRIGKRRLEKRIDDSFRNYCHRIADS